MLEKVSVFVWVREVGRVRVIRDGCFLCGGLLRVEVKLTPLAETENLLCPHNA